jgi:hypothetical protein
MEEQGSKNKEKPKEIGSGISAIHESLKHNEEAIEALKAKLDPLSGPEESAKARTLDEVPPGCSAVATELFKIAGIIKGQRMDIRALTDRIDI